MFNHYQGMISLKIMNYDNITTVLPHTHSQLTYITLLLPLMLLLLLLLLLLFLLLLLLLLGMVMLFYAIMYVFIYKFNCISMTLYSFNTWHLLSQEK